VGRYGIKHVEKRVLVDAENVVSADGLEDALRKHLGAMQPDERSGHFVVSGPLPESAGTAMLPQETFVVENGLIAKTADPS